MNFDIQKGWAHAYQTSRIHMIMLIFGIVVCSIMLSTAYDIRSKYVTETISEFGQLPSEGLQIISLEFKGVVSDYLLFKTITFLGMKISQKIKPTNQEWSLIHQMLLRVTDLDPRFWDPYLLAEMTLVWEAMMIEETNQMLLKASQFLIKDYRPHYFIGFNYFYFQKNTIKAAPHFRMAALAPNAPDYVKGLAARVSLYSRETAIGISFLEDLIQHTQDPKIIKYLQKRLIALKMIDYLEQWVLEFKKRKGELPKRIEDLVIMGLIPSIPKDPYEGSFYVLENGRVYTTSELIGPERHKKNTQMLPF